MSQITQHTADETVMVIEEMKHTWKTAAGRGNLDHPINVNRRIHVERVHVVEFSMEGAYIGRNFGENPHYMVDYQSLTRTIIPTCELWGIPVTRYPSKNKIASSNILCIWQSLLSPVEENHEKRNALPSSLDTVQREFINLGFEEMYAASNNTQHAIHAEKTISSRGAIQEHYGYTSNNSLTRVVDAEGKVSVRPALIGGTVPPEWKTRFVSMTKIGDAMFEDPESSGIRDTAGPGGLYSDSYRNECFASKIENENKVGALTFSQTSTDGPKLKIHVEKHNDETDNGIGHNYNFIVCAWKLFSKPDGTVVRIALIAYSRRSIADFFLRSELCRKYTKNYMTPWLSDLPRWKRNIDMTSDVFTLDYFEGNANSDTDGNLFFPPILNKQASYLSAFADHILQFKDVFEKTTTTRMTVEKHLELILPIAFCRTADIFCSTLTGWITNKSTIKSIVNKDKNLTLSYMSAVLTKYGSLGAGRYARHQPTFNIVPDNDWVRSSLLCLRETVMLSLHNKQYSFRMLTDKICSIKHVGPLLAQHLVHVMALVGIVHPLFGSGAKICEGTHTSRRLQNKYSIPRSSHQSLLEFVCATYSWLPNVAENGVCKHEQPEGTHFNDVLYATQRSVMWVVPWEDSFRIAYVTRDSRNIVKQAGERTFTHKICAVYHGSTIPFEATPNGEEKNCPRFNTSRDSTLKTQWWYHLEKDEYHILENNRSRPKKRKCSITTDSVSKQARTTSPSYPVADSSTGVVANPKVPIVAAPRPTDWLSIDRKEMQRIVTQYEKDIKTCLMKTANDGFGESKGDLSIALRAVHAAGKHYVVPSRTQTKVATETNGIGSSVLGETKAATHLLSMGVPMVSWNLLRAAEKAVIEKWMLEKKTGADLRGKFVVKFSVVSVRSRSADHKYCGPTYFVAKASLNQNTMGHYHVCKNMVIPQDVFGTNKGMLHEGAVSGMFHAVDHASENVIPRNDDRRFSFAFNSTFHARLSLMWYLLWTDSAPEKWLQEYFPRYLWRTTKSSVTHKTTPVDRNNLLCRVPAQYLLVTLQNGPKSAMNGSIFCTLILTGDKGVWVRIESGFGKTRRLILSTKQNGGFFRICPTDPFHTRDPFLTSNDLPVEEVNTTRVSVAPNNDNDDIVATSHGTPFVKEGGNTQRGCAKFTNYTIGVPFSIPTNGSIIAREVLLVDPIDINNIESFSRMSSDLKGWRFAWGNVLSQWKSTLLKRKSVEQADKYWHPPGTGSNYRLIRSKPDLRKFLTLCSEEYSTVSTDSQNTVVDFLSAAEAFSKV